VRIFYALKREFTVTFYSKLALVKASERWAWSWSRCTGSQPAGNCESSTWR